MQWQMYELISIQDIYMFIIAYAKYLTSIMWSIFSLYEFVFGEIFLF